MENIANTLLNMINDKDSSSRLLLSKNETSFLINDCIKNVFGNKELVTVGKVVGSNDFLTAVKVAISEDAEAINMGNGGEDESCVYTLGYANQAVSCLNSNGEELFNIHDMGGILKAVSHVNNEDELTEVTRTYNCNNGDSTLKVAVNGETTIESSLNPYDIQLDYESKKVGYIANGKIKSIRLFNDECNIVGYANKIDELSGFNSEELHQAEGMKI